jgi:hypothetical protein
MPEPIPKTELATEDACQRNNPMEFCKVCGTYMHCKEEEGPWIKRTGEMNEHRDPVDQDRRVGPPQDAR